MASLEARAASSGINHGFRARQSVEIPPMVTLEQIKKDYFEKNAPLAGKLNYHGERPTVPEEELNTSGHETNHALAFNEFNTNSSISLEPQGDSLARTIPHGSLPYRYLKYVLAAGAVNPARGGHAWGYGHDLHQAGLINLLQGISYYDTGAVIQAASGIVNLSHPKEIREKATEIVYRMGGTNDFKKVLEQAYFEFKMDGKNFDQFFENNELQRKDLENLIKLIEANETDNRNVFIEKIEDLEDHSVRVVYYFEDKPDEIIDLTSCPHCGGINSHEGFCTPEYRMTSQNSYLELENENEDNLIQNDFPVETPLEPEEENTDSENSGVIFSRVDKF